MNRFNVKALRVSDFPEEAWIILGEGGSGQDRTIYELYETVDYLYRGVTLRAQKLASVPFVILKGTADFYDSEAGEPPPKGFEWLDDLPIFLEMVEAAICLGGRAYIWPVKNKFNFIRELQWYVPTSVDPWYDTQTGELLHFRRHGPKGKIDEVDPADLVYFWPPDPTRETGPARRFPGRAAMSAAGVLANMDTFLEHYFGRGAIKVTLLTTEGMVRDDQRKLLKAWWEKVTAGISRAFGSEVVNANKVTPVVIGEGVKDLENTALTQEKREAICAALGVPPSKMLPSAANYATKQSDDVMLVSDTVVPELRWIGRTLNKQLFGPMGLSIKFDPESLPEMQVDENERAESLLALTTAGMPLLLALDTLGYNIDAKWVAKLEEAERQKEEMREAGAAALAQAGNKPKEDEDEGEPSRPPLDKTWKLARQLDEAGRLERWLKNGPDRDPADFASDILTDEEKRHIKAIVDGKLIPRGQPVHIHLETPAELADPDDIARLVTDVEKWARRHNLDLDKILEAEEDPLEA